MTSKNDASPDSANPPSFYMRNALWVLVTVVVSFWIGVLFDKVFQNWNAEFLKLLIDTAVAIGTVGAVVVALFVGNQQASAVMKSVREAHLLEVAARQRSILAIAEAAHVRAEAIGNVLRDVQAVPVALFEVYDRTIIAGIVGALSGVPAHEIGSRDGVLALLSMRDQFVFLGITVETFIANPWNDPDLRQMFEQLSEPEYAAQRKELATTARVVRANNVQIHVRKIAEDFESLKKAIDPYVGPAGADVAAYFL